jgi:hypothetical protein
MTLSPCRARHALAQNPRNDCQRWKNKVAAQFIQGGLGKNNSLSSLQNGGCSIAEVATESGFGEQSNLGFSAAPATSALPNFRQAQE